LFFKAACNLFNHINGYAGSCGDACLEEGTLLEHGELVTNKEDRKLVQAPMKDARERKLVTDQPVHQLKRR